MSNTKLGRLEKVNLRSCWESEPRDFTPWLAEEENIILLGETLGIELEVQQTEASVGSFSADIVCLNTADNSVVLIENQLERTDHTHLGQIMTYAAGLDAVTVIWIASRFTEEHRAAVDWFNSISDEAFNFFGIEIEVWRIGDSVAAPKFNIVAKPNEWAKMLKDMGASPGAMTPSQKNFVDYWQSFADFIEAQGSTWRRPKPYRCHWMAWSLGRSYFGLHASVVLRSGRAEVYVNLEDKEAKSFFHQLHSQKDEIEGEAGFEMDWQERPDIKTSYIKVSKVAELDDRRTWPEVHAWMLEHLTIMDRVFRPRIKGLNAADWVPTEEST